MWITSATTKFKKDESQNKHPAKQKYFNFLNALCLYRPVFIIIITR